MSRPKWHLLGVKQKNIAQLLINFDSPLFQSRYCTLLGYTNKASLDGIVFMSFSPFRVYPLHHDFEQITDCDVILSQFSNQFWKL